MGQYYTTVIKPEKDFEESTIFKIDNDCFESWIGVKLMEHSWLGCIWADLIAHTLYKKKCRVAEVGDYAYEFPLYNVVQSKQFEDCLQCLDIDEYKKDGDFIKFDYYNKYLVNHDKKIYIDFNHYISKSKDEYGYIASPINLLCAQGNGRGGGDYYVCYPHFYDVGDWAWDLISIEDKVPFGFLKSEIYFKEDSDDDNV